MNFFTCYAKRDFITNSDGDYVIPNLPFKFFGIVSVSEGRYVHDRLTDKTLETKEAISRIVIDLDDKKTMELLSGYLGESISDALLDPDYINHYPYTMSQQKSKYDENGVFVEYEGSDKNDISKFVED